MCKFIEIRRGEKSHTVDSDRIQSSKKDFGNVTESAMSILFQFWGFGKKLIFSFSVAGSLRQPDLLDSRPPKGIYLGLSSQNLSTLR